MDRNDNIEGKSMVEMIEHNGELIAMIVRREYHREGIQFFTKNDGLLQLGYISRPMGYLIKPHEHNPVHRHIVGTHEVLLMKSGKIRIDFFSYQKAYLESRELSTGDMVLLAGAGHGIAFLEPSTMVEVKNGPYIEDVDKKRYEGKKE